MQRLPRRRAAESDAARARGGARRPGSSPTATCGVCAVTTSNEREKLHLSDGTSSSFEESWRLCTQCHGKKLADWRAGVHGKRTGHWLGAKEYRTCVVCHNPHAPPFEPLEPKPPPLRPDADHFEGERTVEEIIPMKKH